MKAEPDDPKKSRSCFQKMSLITSTTAVLSSVGLYHQLFAKHQCCRIEKFKPLPSLPTNSPNPSTAVKCLPISLSLPLFCLAATLSFALISISLSPSLSRIPSLQPPLVFRLGWYSAFFYLPHSPSLLIGSNATPLFSPISLLLILFQWTDFYRTM